MATLAMAVPVKEGKAAHLRAVRDETLGPRKQEFEADQKRLGITREIWYLQSSPMGDLLTVWIESDDPTGALKAFAEDREPGAIWLKEQMLDISG
ncbi:MAG TPA: hypothetical protein VFA49_06930, partial [Chloroflexota bacterium]|nr:hypothetical protein [Chloroflexota bacterium]